MNHSGAELLERSEAEWIWTKTTGCEVNQYVEFRHEFVLYHFPFDSAQLFISADSDYAVWINGTFIDCGQYHDYPEHKSFDILDVGKYLRPGGNVICFLAYYQGFSTMQYIKGIPGLIYVLDTKNEKISSGNHVYARQSQSYKNGSIEMITAQLGFSFEYNADKYDFWINDKYEIDESWMAAIPNILLNENQVSDFFERPIKKLVLKENTKAKVIAQGIFSRQNISNTVAETMQSDLLSPIQFTDLFSFNCENMVPSERGIEVDNSYFNNNMGVYFLIDLNSEESGLLSLDLNSEEGMIIDIAYGEHLEDLRVRSSIGGRNFACRYICCSGRQEFHYYFKRFGCRYIELHVSGPGNKFVLHYAGIDPWEYPIAHKGSFHCNDPLFNKIYEVSRRTLELCMHEHYEDCPWREQALYSMDSRNQALCGYYCFGEYDFPQASFELLGLGLQEDGYINLCAPSEFPITIPSFSMAWIMEIADHLLYSGRIDVAASQYTRIKKMMGIYISTLKGGLLPCPKQPKFWHFYEWVEGMYDEFPELDKTNTNKYTYDDSRMDAPLNLFFILALDSAAFIADYCGDSINARMYKLISEEVKNAVTHLFWDDNKKAYKTYLQSTEGNNYSELTQSLALFSKTCHGKLAENLREKLSTIENGLVKCTLSHSIFKYESLLQEPEKYAKFVFDSIAEDWGYMLNKGATSFWETINGASDFDGAGSLCHGWSSIPIYFYQAYVLGIKPEMPGFKSFSVHPIFNVCDSAFGKIPTPFGDINISWEKTTKGTTVKVEHPEGIIIV